MDDEASDVEASVTLESVNHSRTIHSGLLSTYASQWEPVEAFRELVQNWRDGITQSHGLREEDFKVTKEFDDDERIVYTWSGKDGYGVVELINRGAELQPWHLNMGGSTKTNNTQQAGCHGEGLKLAICVLLREPQNHPVLYYSGGFTWTFNFTNQRRMVARLVRMSDAELTKFEEKAGRFHTKNLYPFIPSPKKDVHVVIGGNSSGNDENGNLTRRTKVNREEFRKWTTAAVFLQNIEFDGMVRTSKGDLITDPRFSGNIYLKGLLLMRSRPGASASITGKQLQYGYSFQTGTTNRERQSLASANAESKAILDIWNEALKDQYNNKGLIAKFHEMLNSRDPEYADVAGAERFIGSKTALCLRDYLLSQEHGRRWYFTSEELSQHNNPRKQIEKLKFIPYELPRSYWSIMKRMGYFHTIEEEFRVRLLRAAAVPIPPTTFAQAVNRLLCSALRICKYTHSPKVQFVGANDCVINTCFLAEDVINVHDRWLSVDTAVEELGISEELAEPDIVRSTVQVLLLDIIREMSVEETPPPERSLLWMKQAYFNRANYRVFDSIRIGTELKFTGKRASSQPPLRSLTISWNNQAGWKPDDMLSIELHRESSCQHLKANRLLSRDVSGPIAHCIGKGQCYKKWAPFSRGSQTFPGIPRVRDHTTITSSGPQTRKSETFEKGRRASQVDITIPREWYDAKSSTGTEAILGIKTQDPYEGGPRKKPRTSKDE
ncbi:hypothetical protein F4778DRAFT_791612 [Xylariomycetidae sp. FL2044]|nr:hypothetical protein F4778DRAFT_791612 [Xylariomycetidae sp. FL2044]